MKCPKCRKKLELWSKTNTADQKSKKKYLRTIYHCKKDDIWLAVEIPKASK